MEELIDTVLSVRTESRREAFHYLVKILSDTDVGEDLFYLYSIVDQNDSAVDAYRQFEDHILKLTDEFLARLGAHFDYDFINNELSSIVGLFKLLDAIETFEDIDGLLAIASSEEDEFIILNNLSLFIFPDETYDYTGGFEHLEPRFINNIKENITGRKKDMDNEVYFAERGKRLLNFLLDNPEVPFYNVFESFMSFTTPESMVNAFDFDENPVEMTDSMIATLTTGVLVGTTDSENEAMSNAEKVVNILDQNEIFGIGDYYDIREGVIRYFNAEVEEDES